MEEECISWLPYIQAGASLKIEFEKILGCSEEAYSHGNPS
jgi:hypothetical protein